jgi:hypothetical protein
MKVSQELDIIAQIRSEVMEPKEVTGPNPFLIWGYPTAFFLLLEFAALILLNKNWCWWLWVGIPIVGIPLMIYLMHKDYKLTHCRTIESNAILKIWAFIGFLSAVCGLSMGFAGVFEQCYCACLGIIVSIGCFITGMIIRYRPKMVCGMMGAVLSLTSLFFQGDLWPWQLLIAALVAVVTLIIPGHMFNQYIKNHGF